MVPCNWPVSYEQCGACEPLEWFSEDAQETFEEMAVEYLWNWTGRIYGTCPVVLRPCRNTDQREFAAMYSTFYGRGPYGMHSETWGPVLIGGEWFNLYCGCCGSDRCSCTGDTNALIIPGPIVSVEEILIDGNPLDPAAYRVDDRKMIVRLDGLRWPSCQNMSAPPTDSGTWQISYTRGTPVPKGGEVAAGILALELMKAACNDASCQLPKRVQSITRQGVTVAVLDSFSDVQEGRTGIWLIDAWLTSVTKPSMGGAVRSVDVGRKGRVTTQQNATFYGSTGGGAGVGGL